MSGPEPAAPNGAPDPARPTPAEAGPPAEPGPSAPPAASTDLGRRRFFRQFASEMFHTAATVVGTASAIQRSTVEAAGAILTGPEELLGGPGPGSTSGPTAPAGSTSPAFDDVWARAGAAAALASGGPAGAVMADPAQASGALPSARVGGYRSAFRVEGERILLVDQRHLPFSLGDVECRTAIDVSIAIGDRAIVGSSVIAQAGALGIAFTANRVRASRPYARRAILRAAESTLLGARPTSRPLRSAVERVMARYLAIGELDEDGGHIADAMLDEAETIIFEANDDHGRIADAAAVRIPRRPDRPAGILTLGSTGTMAGGQFGTALGAVVAATYADVPLHVYVAEGRPTFDGARIVAWELAQAGTPHTVLPDAAVGSLLQGGLVDVVLVGAEAIAWNGDLANETGTYPIAALASRHGVPVVVCAPLAALDPAADDGRGLVTANGRPTDVLNVGGMPVGTRDTDVLNPVVDITPAGLISAFATEEGLIEAPFSDGFAAALLRRAERLPTSLLGAVLVADAADAAPPPDPAAGANAPDPAAGADTAAAPDRAAPAPEPGETA